VRCALQIKHQGAQKVQQPNQREREHLAKQTRDKKFCPLITRGARWLFYGVCALTQHKVQCERNI
jgi:hypothetical protein